MVMFWDTFKFIFLIVVCVTWTKFIANSTCNALFSIHYWSFIFIQPKQ